MLAEEPVDEVASDLAVPVTGRTAVGEVVARAPGEPTSDDAWPAVRRGAPSQAPNAGATRYHRHGIPRREHPRPTELQHPSLLPRLGLRDGKR